MGDDLTPLSDPDNFEVTWDSDEVAQSLTAAAVPTDSPNSPGDGTPPADIPESVAEAPEEPNVPPVVHTGAMIALVPSVADAQRLAVDGGESANQLHCTLMYLGDAAQFDTAARATIVAAVRAACDGWPVVDADGFAVSLFNPGDANDRNPCVVLGLSGTDVDVLHDIVEEVVGEVEAGQGPTAAPGDPAAADTAGDVDDGPAPGDDTDGDEGWVCPDQHAPYIPHITLAYTDDASTAADLIDRVGPLTFDRIRVVFADSAVDLPLDAEGPMDLSAYGITVRWDAWIADSIRDAIAGIFASDRNLRAYWEHGKGAAKIRWGAPKDWHRCVAHLRKYVADAKGLCTTYHHEVLGVWPGQEDAASKVTTFDGALVPAGIGGTVTSPATTDPDSGPAAVSGPAHVDGVILPDSGVSVDQWVDDTYSIAWTGDDGWHEVRMTPDQADATIDALNQVRSTADGARTPVAVTTSVGGPLLVAPAGGTDVRLTIGPASVELSDDDAYNLSYQFALWLNREGYYNAPEAPVTAAFSEELHPRDPLTGRFLKKGLVGRRDGGATGSTAIPNTNADGGFTADDIAARQKKVEDVIGRARKTLSTDVTHAQDGSWNPDRDQLHRKIAAEWYAKAKDVPNDGKAVIAGGLGGAGKSTVLRDYAGIDPKQFLTLNPDDIKEDLAKRGLVPDVPDAPELSPMERAALVHEESSRIAHLIADMAYRDKKNVIWDVTMSSKGSAKSRIDALKRNGYGDVQGVFVDIPVEVSVKRALARYQRGVEQWSKGSGEGGRFVPPEIIRAQAAPGGGTINRGVFDDLRNDFSGWSVYDNSVDGRAPQLVDQASPVGAGVGGGA